MRNNLHGRYWDMVNHRQQPTVFTSNKPMFPCSFLGPVPDPRMLEEKAASKEKPSVEDVIEAERRAVRQSELDAMPGAAEVKTELDKEFARKKNEVDSADGISEKLRAPADHRMSYPKRNKEKGNE